MRKRFSPGDLETLEILLGSNIFALSWQPDCIEGCTFTEPGGLKDAKDNQVEESFTLHCF